ncbi:GTP 3',8-cyclase MoaA [Pelobacter propionicus]|uniref:GTP 3',8-cyclase n=1 Tax=Pelobacter propionicus (strain DSM 2379 / NBRC 103807 / OttBd1) TaxID=338966 RepID=A1AKR8_PELPD|nr:GTP 3',8-cyclase MoaA [Pelobacter propionicus]ABK97938.1 GTP cyclohydrolase subunit MoaA [Pelobacter propionicus DSM 2379]
MNLTDSLGRKINYLRLSITDRCNMRCFYCMPSVGVVDKGHKSVLSYEELLLIAETAVKLGIEKIRITGGEPLVRIGVVGFLERLAAIPGLQHLAVTTNGLLLEEMASDLYRAGVQRLNVSLDSLNPETFGKITRGGDLKKVLAGLDAAERAGFPPPKINVVTMRGVNDGEILDFAALTLTRGNPVRFIEYMPAIKENGWQRYCISGSEILERISTRYPLEEVDRGIFSGPSRDYRIPGAQGHIGIITAVSGHFCSECNRIRVTSTGKAKGCLFADEATDLIPWLRPPDREGLEKVLKEVVMSKPERHGITQDGYHHKNFNMSQIGG